MEFDGTVERVVDRANPRTIVEVDDRDKVAVAVRNSGRVTGSSAAPCVLYHRTVRVFGFAPSHFITILAFVMDKGAVRGSVPKEIRGPGTSSAVMLHQFEAVPGAVRPDQHAALGPDVDQLAKPERPARCRPSCIDVKDDLVAVLLPQERVVSQVECEIETPPRKAHDRDSDPETAVASGLRAAQAAVANGQRRLKSCFPNGGFRPGSCHGGPPGQRPQPSSPRPSPVPLFHSRAAMPGFLQEM